MFGLKDYHLFCKDPETKSISEIKKAAIDDLKGMEEAEREGFCPTDYSFYQRMRWLGTVITELTELEKQEKEEGKQNDPN